MGTLNTYRDVLELWRTRAALARVIKVKEGLVRSWHSRDSIPEKHFLRVVKAAETCGFQGITYRLLTDMSSGAALQMEEPPI